LVRLSIVRDGKKSKALARINRAATGERALGRNEIALQYDDRQLLGINRAGSIHRLCIKPVGNWLALPRFLLTHTSPLVRREAAFGVVLMAVGAVIGLVLGLLLNERVWSIIGGH
jgi:hypothetical protein